MKINNIIDKLKIDIKVKKDFVYFRLGVFVCFLLCIKV